jgi:hypothetical protein
MSHFFQFEEDFATSLRCIPMQVRYKLDRCGIKLKLPQWNRFSPEQRYTLIELPCETVDEVQSYRESLKQLIQETTGEVAIDLPIDAKYAWEDESEIPLSVDAKAKELDVPLTLEQWVRLTPLQRFALIKLSRSNHENHNFLPALKEFQVVS